MRNEAEQEPVVREATELAPPPAGLEQDEGARSRRRRRDLVRRPASVIVPKSAAPGPVGPRRRSSTHKQERRNPVVATLTGAGLAAILLLCFMAGPPAVLALAAVAVTLATAELFNSFASPATSPRPCSGCSACRR